jgi:hypothetical protein
MEVDPYLQQPAIEFVDKQSKKWAKELDYDGIINLAELLKPLNQTPDRCLVAICPFENSNSTDCVRPLTSRTANRLNSVRPSQIFSNQTTNDERAFKIFFASPRSCRPSHVRRASFQNGVFSLDPLQRAHCAFCGDEYFVSAFQQACSMKLSAFVGKCAKGRDGFFPCDLATMTALTESDHSAWLNAALLSHNVGIDTLRTLRRTGAVATLSATARVGPQTLNALVMNALDIITRGKRDIMCSQIQNAHEATRSPAVKFMRQILQLSHRDVDFFRLLCQLPCSLLQGLAASAAESELYRFPGCLSSLILEFASPLSFAQLNLGARWSHEFRSVQARSSNSWGLPFR